MKKFGLILISLLLIAGSYYFFLKNPAMAPSDGGFYSDEKIPVVIVPHFNVFADKRTELLKNIGTKNKTQTAVVVSVNHFNSGQNNIITAEREWTLAGGNVKSNPDLVGKLATSGIAVSDESAFSNEHGITNVLPDVRDNVNPVILPIIIKDITPKEDIDKLANWLRENVKDSILIASVDFSHYQPNAIAKAHDSYSIQALSSLDADKIWAAETDSPQTLYLAGKMAEKQDARNFNLYYNSNSGAINNNDDAETTSVVLGYYSDKKSDKAITPSTSFVIAGDAMFDRNVWHNFKNAGLNKIFDNFGTRVFRGSDISLLNLEGPISSKEIDDDWQSGSMVFNFPPETTGTLKYLNVGQVSLANNHTANAGNSGLSNTRKVLDQAGIKYFGQPTGYSESSLLQIDGPIPVSIIGIMALDGFDSAAMNAKIAAEKSAGRTVIVFPHWGEEYKAKHVASQKKLAKEWISAGPEGAPFGGADIIIGSHPHVTEDFEMVRPFDSAQGRPVVYSLGNFVFDQLFSKETQEGLIVAGTITKDKITLSFLPTIEKVVKPQFMTGEKKINKIKTILDINSESGFKKLSSDTIEIQR